MKDAIKVKTEAGIKLNLEERNLLSVAYKNVVGSRRSSWRVITALFQNATEDMKEATEKYRNAIQKELDGICYEVIVSDSVINFNRQLGRAQYDYFMTLY